MNYKEKRTMVQIGTGILIMGAYCVFALGKLSAGTETLDIKFWAIAILVFIGIGIVASIVIQIVFHIIMSIALAIKEQVQNGKVDEGRIERNLELDMVEDEMDQLIELKSMRIGFTFAGLGFVAALVTLVLGITPSVMLHILFGAFSVGSIVEGIVQLYFYKKGVRNGR